MEIVATPIELAVNTGGAAPGSRLRNIPARLFQAACPNIPQWLRSVIAAIGIVSPGQKTTTNKLGFIILEMS